MELKLSANATILLGYDPEKQHYAILINDENKSVIYLTENQVNMLLVQLPTFQTLTNHKVGLGVLIDTHIELKDSLPIVQTTSKPTAELTIYIPDKVVPLLDAEQITNACGDFMEALGFEMETEDEPIYRSFWKKIKFVFSKEASPEELEKLFKKGKRALELRHVELPTAEQTEKLANAAAKVVESLEKFDEGIVRLGTLLVLKKKVDGTPTIIIQQLNQDLIKIFDEKPQLLKSLRTVYELVTGDVAAEKALLALEDQEISTADKADLP